MDGLPYFLSLPGMFSFRGNSCLTGPELEWDGSQAFPTGKQVPLRCSVEHEGEGHPSWLTLVSLGMGQIL